MLVSLLSLIHAIVNYSSIPFSLSSSVSSSSFCDFNHPPYSFHWSSSVYDPDSDSVIAHLTFYPLDTKNTEEGDSVRGPYGTANAEIQEITFSLDLNPSASSPSSASLSPQPAHASFSRILCSSADQCRHLYQEDIDNPLESRNNDDYSLYVSIRADQLKSAKASVLTSYSNGLKCTFTIPDIPSEYSKCIKIADLTNRQIGLNATGAANTSSRSTPSSSNSINSSQSNFDLNSSSSSSSSALFSDINFTSQPLNPTPIVPASSASSSGAMSQNSTTISTSHSLTPNSTTTPFFGTYINGTSPSSPTTGPLTTFGNSSVTSNQTTTTNYNSTTGSSNHTATSGSNATSTLSHILTSSLLPNISVSTVTVSVTVTPLIPFNQSIVTVTVTETPSTHSNGTVSSTAFYSNSSSNSTAGATSNLISHSTFNSSSTLNSSSSINTSSFNSSTITSIFTTNSTSIPTSVTSKSSAVSLSISSASSSIAASTATVQETGTTGSHGHKPSSSNGSNIVPHINGQILFLYFLVLTALA